MGANDPMRVLSPEAVPDVVSEALYAAGPEALLSAPVGSVIVILDDHAHVPREDAEASEVRQTVIRMLNTVRPGTEDARSRAIERLHGPPPMAGGVWVLCCTSGIFGLFAISPLRKGPLPPMTKGGSA